MVNLDTLRMEGKGNPASGSTKHHGCLLMCFPGKKCRTKDIIVACTEWQEAKCTKWIREGLSSGKLLCWFFQAFFAKGKVPQPGTTFHLVLPFASVSILFASRELQFNLLAVTQRKSVRDCLRRLFSFSQKA